VDDIISPKPHFFETHHPKPQSLKKALHNNTTQVDDIIEPFSQDNAGGKIGPTLALHNKQLPPSMVHGAAHAVRGGAREDGEQEARKAGARARTEEKFAKSRGDVPRGTRYVCENTFYL
jgi:hypothetical protein